MYIQMNASDFKRGLRACSQSIAPAKSPREILKRVLVRAYPDGNVEMVGMCDHTMAVSYTEAEIIGDAECSQVSIDYLIEPVVVPKTATTVIIERVDDGIIIAFDDGTRYDQKPQDGAFVNYYRVMQDYPPQFRITVNPAYLARIADICKGEKNVTIGFYGELKPLQVDGDHTRAILLPVRLDAVAMAAREDTIRYRREAHE